MMFTQNEKKLYSMSMPCHPSIHPTIHKKKHNANDYHHYEFIIIILNNEKFHFFIFCTIKCFNSVLCFCSHYVNVENVEKKKYSFPMDSIVFCKSLLIFFFVFSHSMKLSIIIIIIIKL